MAKYNDMTVGQSEACINRMGGWDNFLRFIGGQGKIVFDTILTSLRTVRIAALPAGTISKKYFEEAGVRFMGSNFENQFYGLEVPSVEETELAVRKLKRDSLDVAILAELGDKADISMSQFRAFLAANYESREYFIFYIRKDGNFWAMHARWHFGHRGWHVGTDSVESPEFPCRCPAGRWVVSRD